MGGMLGAGMTKNTLGSLVGVTDNTAGWLEPYYQPNSWSSSLTTTQYPANTYPSAQSITWEQPKSHVAIKSHVDLSEDRYVAEFSFWPGVGAEETPHIRFTATRPRTGAWSSISTDDMPYHHLFCGGKHNSMSPWELAHDAAKWCTEHGWTLPPKVMEGIELEVMTEKIK